MTSQMSPEGASNRSKLSLADTFATTCIAIGAVASAGWLFTIPALSSFSPFAFYPPMLAATAIGAIILGIGLFSLQRQLEQMVWVTGLTSLLLSIAGFTETLGLVQLQAEQVVTGHSAKGQPPFASAISFGLAGVALLAGQRLANANAKLFNLLVFALLYLPTASSLVYLSNAHQQASLILLASYSLPETLTFIAFTFGLVFATENRLRNLFTDSHSASRRGRVAVLTLTGFAILTAMLAAYLNSDGQAGAAVSNGLFAAGLILFALYLVSSLSTTAEKSPAGDSATSHDDSDTLKANLLDFLHNSSDGLLIVDNTGTIQYANRIAARIFAWDENELVHQNMNMLVPKRYRAEHLKHFQQFVHSNLQEKRHSSRGKITGLTRQGVEKQLAISLYRQPDTSMILATIRELSGLERDLVEKTSKQHLDLVTGIPNREEFMRYCSQHWDQKVRKSEDSYCIQVIDLDELKIINSKYGRDFGDSILQTVSTTIKNRLRASDRFFRYSSDEFVLICSNIDMQEAELLAERIRTSIKVTPTKLGDNNIYVTCSIGLVICRKLPAKLCAAVEQISEVLNERDPDKKDQVVDIPQPDE